jgi:hypothetical protein
MYKLIVVPFRIEIIEYDPFFDNHIYKKIFTNDLQVLFDQDVFLIVDENYEDNIIFKGQSPEMNRKIMHGLAIMYFPEKISDILNEYRSEIITKQLCDKIQTNLFTYLKRFDKNNSGGLITTDKRYEKKYHFVFHKEPNFDIYEKEYNLW